MLKNVGENIKKKFALIFFYTLDIKNIIFNPKFYQHFLPSLVISDFQVNPVISCEISESFRKLEIAGVGRVSTVLSTLPAKGDMHILENMH